MSLEINLFLPLFAILLLNLGILNRMMLLWLLAYKNNFIPSIIKESEIGAFQYIDIELNLHFIGFRNSKNEIKFT